jgi:hypothetical protein
MPVLESSLKITAIDETQKAFDSIEARVRGLSATVSSFSRAAAGTGQKVGDAGSFSGAVRRNAGLAARGTGIGAIAGLGASGAVAYGAGRASVEAVKALADRQHELVRMEVAGIPPEEIQVAKEQTAKLAAEFPQVSQDDILHMLRNIRSVTAGFDDAVKITEPLVKLRALAQLARPGEDVSEDFDQLTKGLEIKGVTQNLGQFKEYIDGIAKGINLLGDTLKPYQYYEMFKYGRQATSALSEKFILGTAPTLAQELGGQGTGAAIAAFNRLLVSGVGKKGSFEELSRLGLLDKDAVADIPGTGEGQGIKAGRTVKGWRLAQSDPYLWMKEYLLPAFDKAGITDKDEQLREIGTLFQSQRAAQMVNLLATQQNRVDKTYGLIQPNPGLSAADTSLAKDPLMAWQAVKNSIWSTAGTIGESINLSEGMTKLAREIARLNYEDIVYSARTKAKPDLWESGRAPPGRDARSPSTGPYAYYPAPPAINVSEQAPPVAPGRDPRSPPNGPYAYYPAQPQGQQAIKVSGEAQVEHTIHLEVTLDPALRAQLDQATNSQDFTVPLIGGGAGRMDSDAAPHRVGGIGAM